MNCTKRRLPVITCIFAALLVFVSLSVAAGDKVEKKVTVYCNSGSRSYSAYRKLGKLAYPDIFQTLFADWKDAGFPIEK